MFGDAGHGIILTVFSAYMVIYEQQLSKTKSSNEVNITMYNIIVDGFCYMTAVFGKYVVREHMFVFNEQYPNITRFF